MIFLIFGLFFSRVLLFYMWSSGGTSKSHEQTQVENSHLLNEDSFTTPPPDDHNERILAARERFLARKAKK